MASQHAFLSAPQLELTVNLRYATDTESAFGGIIAFNRELDAETAKAIVERQFNVSDQEAFLIPIQDGGLQTYLRALDIRFS